MRFLLDHNISPKVADPLRAAGHDVAVVREVGMSRATDEVVIDFARRERRVLVSADTDFGTILARTRASTPSFVLIRRMAHERPSQQASMILDNLPTVADDLEAGAIVVLGDRTLRIRLLPLG
jgi:predicted nuclease of predicted toxin-antitoxin system